MIAVAFLLWQAASPLPAPVPPNPPAGSVEQLTPAGRDALQQVIEQADRRSAAQAERARVARAAIERAALARPVDMAVLRSALEARDMIDVERLLARTTDAILLLDRLGPADREVVIGMIPGLGGAGTARPPLAPPAPPTPPAPPAIPPASPAPPASR